MRKNLGKTMIAICFVGLMAAGCSKEVTTTETTTQEVTDVSTTEPGTETEVKDTPEENTDGVNIVTTPADVRATEAEDIAEGSTDRSSTTETSIDVQEASSYTGIWKINGEMTQNNLINYNSIYDVYGSGLKTCGAETEFTDSGEFSMFMGVGYSATGTYQIVDGKIVVDAKLFTGEGEKTTPMTYDIVTVDGVEYLTSVIYGETVYWSR